MNTGLGFSEILLIATLVLIFFGSKEIPQFVKVIAKFMARVRFYTDKVKRELDSVTQTTQVPFDNDYTKERKNKVRSEYLAARKNLTETERQEKSSQIMNHLINAEFYQFAESVLIYVDIGSEVATRKIMNEMLRSGKRVVVPYCKETGEMGIAEIRDPEQDLVIGCNKIPEPRQELRISFFKSDLHLIICPGVAFDIYGGRLGRGKAYYDRFLKELKGQIPLVGMAYGCQISQDPLPFDYHDVAMDQIITESGMLLKNTQMPSRIVVPVPLVPAG